MIRGYSRLPCACIVSKNAIPSWLNTFTVRNIPLKPSLLAPLVRGFFMFIFMHQTLAAQTLSPGEIHGQVFDAETNEALPGANVQILGTLLGANADREGKFVIKKLAPGFYTLRATFIGYHLGRATVYLTEGAIARVQLKIKPTLLEMSQVVVTATRQAEDIQTATVSMSALSNESALRRNNLRLDAALESIPGVSLVAENVNVRNSTGYTRGLGSRVLILLDGIPALPSDFGNMNWDILPVTDFERIEVMKGPASALYGSFALGGVINVITKTPTPEGRFAIRTSAGIYDEPHESAWHWTDRTLHFNRTDVSYARQFGKLGMRASLGRHESTGDRENRHFQRWNGTAKLSYAFNEQAELTLFGAYARDRRGEFVWARLDSPFVVPLAFKDYRLALDAYTFYTQFRLRPTDWLEFKWRASLVRQLTGNQFKVEGDFEPAQGPGADFNIRAQLDSAMSFTVGMEYHYDYAEQRQIGRHFAYTIAPYLQQVWQMRSNLRFTFGLRYDHFYLLPGDSIQIKTVYNPSKSRFETVTVRNPLWRGLEEQYLNPQIGFSYSLFPATVLHAAFGRGIRIPVLGERFLQFDQPIPFRPNTDVQTERSRSFEIGVRQRFGELADIEAVAFHNRYDRLIEPVFVASGTSFYATLVNIREAQIPGVELSGRVRLWQNRFRVEASATWTDPKIVSAGTNDKIPLTFKDNDPLTYRPRFISSLSPSLQLGPFELAADYSYASRVEVQLFRSDQRVAKKQLDGRVLYRWSNLTAQFAVRNLLQYYYAQVERNFNEVRNFSVGLMWEY